MLSVLHLAALLVAAPVTLLSFVALHVACLSSSLCPVDFFFFPVAECRRRRKLKERRIGRMGVRKDRFVGVVVLVSRCLFSSLSSPSS